MQNFSQDSLEALTRRQLQHIAKQLGIRANLKSSVIIEEVLEQQKENLQKLRLKSKTKKTVLTPIKIPSSPFLLKLGSGSDVQVYKYDRDPKSPWAVKRLTVKADSLIEARMQREIEILKSLDHPNIVGFRNSSVSSGRLTFCMEMCDASLLQHINQRKSNSKAAFPVDQVMLVALHIARALQYLHETHFLLHGDMKSANVLIIGQFKTAKLCDFGVCVELNQNLKGQKNPAREVYQGTEAWWPKETIGQADPNNITDRTDIFPYGLTLLEMLTLEAPHDYLLGEENKDSESIHDDSSHEETEAEKQYLRALGSCPPFPQLSSEYKLVVEVIASCCNENWKKRPSARMLVQAIESESLTF